MEKEYLKPEFSLLKTQAEYCADGVSGTHNVGFSNADAIVDGRNDGLADEW